MRVLFFGDVVGKTGRRGLAAILPKLRKKHKPHLVIANGENAAHGSGLTVKTASALFNAGVDFITSGNHIFKKRDQAEEVFAKFPGRVIRPGNFEGQLIGKGWGKVPVGKTEVFIANFNSQVFMENQFEGLISSPFKALDKFLQNVPKSSIIIIDFHSEATSEKRAFGFYADGRVSAVIGTHTHVPTADAQILPRGTAYLSDVGMVGAADTVLGVDKQKAVNGFLTGRFVGEGMVESSEAEVGYAIIEIAGASGQAKSIRSFVERVKI